MDDPILTVENLSKSFGALKACDGVNLDLRAGEIHALIGPNGAGKSTVMKLLAGEIPADGGDIRFRGAVISRLGAVERARLGLARTFQVSAVVPEFTVLQNLLLAAVGASRRPFRFFARPIKDKNLLEVAHRQIERFGLSERADTSVARISHGERRKLEVALALAIEPRVLLMDEPMAGMGPDGSKALTAGLAELKNEVPILLVEHDMDAVFALADRLSVLVYGRVIASGTAAEITENQQVREAYLGENA